ncbi:MAG: hypothetical protein LBH84_04815 [Prevotellaceae bacterium]|nr:hypothetical protein [Prevotellaceae bacterium]
MAGEKQAFEVQACGSTSLRGGGWGFGAERFKDSIIYAWAFEAAACYIAVGSYRLRFLRCARSFLARCAAE